MLIYEGLWMDTDLPTFFFIILIIYLYKLWYLFYLNKGKIQKINPIEYFLRITTQTTIIIIVQKAFIIIKIYCTIIRCFLLFFPIEDQGHPYKEWVLYFYEIYFLAIITWVNMALNKKMEFLFLIFDLMKKNKTHS